MKVIKITCSIIVVLLLGIVILNNIVQELYDFNLSGSIENAKKEKIFVKRIKAKPTQLVINDTNIEFDDCWIEKTSHIKHLFLLFPQVKAKKPTSYYVCFTLKNPHSDRVSLKYSFKPKGSEYSFAIENWALYYHEIKSIDIKELKVDVLEGSRLGKKLGEFSFEL